MRQRSGVGLLVVLAAIVIMSFAMIPIFTSFQGARLGAEKSINYLIAANLITSQLESFRSKPYKEVEEYLLGFRGVPRVMDLINGPFESSPESPDLIEKGVFKAGEVVFDRYTFVAYFPQANPSPNAVDFWLRRQRVRVRTDVLWKEPIRGQTPREVRLSVSTLIHNESFAPKPGQVPPQTQTQPDDEDER